MIIILKHLKFLTKQKQTLPLSPSFPPLLVKMPTFENCSNYLDVQESENISRNVIRNYLFFYSWTNVDPFSFDKKFFAA